LKKKIAKSRKGKKMKELIGRIKEELNNNDKSVLIKILTVLALIVGGIIAFPIFSIFSCVYYFLFSLVSILLFVSACVFVGVELAIQLMLFVLNKFIPDKEKNK